MIVLRVIAGGGLGSQKSLDAESVTIGRSTKCDLTIADFSLSREHARIFRKETGWFVEDLGSRNGTFVKGVRVVGARALERGDGLTMGDTVVIVETLPVPASPLRETAETLGPRAFLRPAADLLRAFSPNAREQDQAVHPPLQRYAERLRLMQEVHQALSRTVVLQDLLEMVLDRVFLHLRPDEGAVFLRSEDGAVERVAGRSTLPGAEARFFSRTLAEEVIGKGHAALVQDALLDERFEQAKSVLHSGVRSIVAAPLMDADGTLGMIVLCSRAAIRQFNEEDMELLAFLASAAALRIRNIALAGEAEKRRLLESELLLARRIQEAVLPKRLPSLPGYALHAMTIPSRVVSGDLYQVLVRGDGAEGVFFVADIAGKGLAAALLTTSLEALCAVPIESGRSPDEIFSGVSTLLYRRTPPEEYATGVIVVLDRETGALRYANAGHNPPLLLRGDGREEWLEGTGAPLGILPNTVYTMGRAALGPGDALVLYTDGVTDAADAAGEEYGEERLAALCRRHRDAPPEALMAALQQDLETFVRGVPFADDRTVVILRRDKPVPLA